MKLCRILLALFLRDTVYKHRIALTTTRFGAVRFIGVKAFIAHNTHKCILAVPCLMTTRPLPCAALYNMFLCKSHKRRSVVTRVSSHRCYTWL